MGYIYKVTCKTTQKIYIGKTESNIEDRWRGHYRAAFLPSHSDYNFPFHRAIRKYGWEDFEIEIIDQTDNSEELKEKEKYYIQYYDSYNNGYNASLGGDGHTKYDYNAIVNFYLTHNFSVNDTCTKFHIYDQVLYTALKAKNIDYKNLKPSPCRKTYNKPILLIEKNLIFNKISDIDKYFNKIVHPNIRRCLQGITKKAYGFHWKELEEKDDLSQYMVYE